MVGEVSASQAIKIFIFFTLPIICQCQSGLTVSIRMDLRADVIMFLTPSLNYLRSLSVITTVPRAVYPKPHAMNLLFPP